MKKIFVSITILTLVLVLNPDRALAAQMPWWRSATPAAAGTTGGQLKNRVNKMENFTGTVSAVSANTLTVDGKVVTVSSLTKFIRRFGGSSSLAEVKVGDKVSVMGNAKVIRNWSVQKRKGAFLGTIQAMTATGFTLQSLNRGVQTVTVSALTKYVNRKEQAISFTDLIAGHKVRVKGLWDSKLNTITEVSQVKDYSRPNL